MANYSYKNYKIVDADQLNNDLTTVADAIREKSGTSETFSFPDGFVSGVAAIEAGGDSVLGSDGKLKTSVLPDGYPYSYYEETEILSECTVAIEGTAQITASSGITDGDTYKVIWDGDEYDCTAWFFEPMGGIMLGNGQLFGISGMGEEDAPFLFMNFYESREFVVFANTGTYTFSIPTVITVKNVIQLDREFIPIDLDGYRPVYFGDMSDTEITGGAQSTDVPRDLQFNFMPTNKFIQERVCVNIEDGSVGLAQSCMKSPVYVDSLSLDLSTFTEQSFTYTLEGSSVNRIMLMDITDTSSGKRFNVSIGYGYSGSGTITAENVVVMNGTYYYVVTNGRYAWEGDSFTVTIKKLGSVI